MLHDVGEDVVGMVYTDGGSGIIRASNRLGLHDDLSTPVVHETNAVAARYDQYEQDGMRVLLVQAGMAAVCWPYAATCFVMLSNLVGMAPRQGYYPGMTRWHARTGAPLKGHMLPFWLCCVFPTY